ncbi:hypothetical protein HN954_03355 [bacterium]|nr:hypothetical protein [bacterium]MBT6832346.1 hypothetical protein [bacterium]MBT6996441.1 hypothetical protein [bacterium]MBT7772752.1 hypothetical protein [bacterium]
MVSVGTMSFQEVILDVLEKAKSKQCYFVWENCPIVVDRNATVESLEQQFQRRTQRKKAFENGQKLAAEFVEKVNQRAEEWQEVHWRKSYGY